MTRRAIVVLGAGASGYAAAITAAQTCRDVVLVDYQDKTARKVLASGNGRCNLGNTDIAVSHYVTQQPQRLAKWLADTASVEAFWRRLGVLVTADEAGRLYPWSNRAQSVADALKLHAQAMGVGTLQAKVCALSRHSDGWQIQTDGAPISAARVIVALGSSVAPQLGATDTAYLLAQQLGLSVVAPKAALAPLRTEPCHPSLKGCRQWAALTLSDGHWQRTEYGEVLFTDYGVSGVAAMQLSPFLARARTLYIDLFWRTPYEQLRSVLMERVQSSAYPTVQYLLVGLLDKPLSYAILKAAGISPLDKPTRTVTDAQVEALCRICKQWPFTVQAPYDSLAQVCAGGISLAELDDNLQSKRALGVYWCGEALDVTGLCGGYNLHWAWLSGLIAGAGAARAD